MSMGNLQSLRQPQHRHLNLVQVIPAGGLFRSQEEATEHEISQRPWVSTSKEDKSQFGPRNLFPQ